MNYNNSGHNGRQEPRRFYRSRKDRMIAGVCGGLAEYFNIDPVLVRVLMVFLLPMGFWAYLILWIVTPEEPWHSGSGGQ